MIVRLRREEGHTWSEIRNTTGVPVSTAQHIVEIEEKEGRIAKKHKGGNKKNTTPAAVRAAVVSAQESDAALRLTDLRGQVQTLFPAIRAPSLPTIHRILEQTEFTTKEMEKYANDRNTEITKRKRKEWVETVGSKLDASTAIFIDETPFSMTMMRHRGRSRKGVPALGVVPAIRGKNHSVIAAISPVLGLVYFEIKVTEPEMEFVSKRKGAKKQKTAPRGVTRDVFRQFLINLFHSPAFESSSHPFTLVYDNARIHLGDIDEVIFQCGHIPQRLPPWSPELDPIEYAFSKWKFAYRVHYPPAEDAVDPAIRESAKSITPADCLHAFEHTQSLYPACRAMEDL